MIHRHILNLLGLWFLLGAMYCMAMSRPAVFAACATAGCRMTEGITIGGISPWYMGAAGYAWLAVLCWLSSTPLWRHKQRVAATLLKFSLAAGLVVDGVFLLVMLTVLRTSCMLCLYAGAFLVVSPLLLTFHTWCPLLLGWFMLFVLGVGLLAGSHTGVRYDRGVEIWFSPTCPPCIETLEKYGGKPGVVLHPVAKDERDKELLWWMESGIRAGLSPLQAWDYARTRNEEGKAPSPPLSFAVRLLRNKAFVAENGGTLPLVLFHGAPVISAGNVPQPLIGGNCGAGSLPCDGQ